MTPVCVLVTGAGGGAGISVIRDLKQKGHRVIATDCDPLAAGLRLADAGAVLPPFAAPDYVDSLVETAILHGATCLMSTLAEEMVSLSDASARFTADGLAHWLPSPTAVTSCIDKWQFALRVRHSGDPAPATGLGSHEGIPGPWIVKPRFGRGSRDVFAVDEPDDVEWALRHVPDPIVQTRLTGREFTVDVLVGRDGDVAGAVPRWRLETKAGISTKGETFSSESLAGEVARLMSSLGLTGPANVQGFVSAEGETNFVEVNPRFSGGLPLSLAAGADLVGEYLRGLMGEPIRPDRLGFKPRVTMVRHFEEIFEGLDAPADAGSLTAAR